MRATVVRIDCARCKGVKYEGPSTDKLPPEENVMISAKALGFVKDIVLDDLCEKCRKRVTDLISDILLLGKSVDGKSDKVLESEDTEASAGALPANRATSTKK